MVVVRLDLSQAKTFPNASGLIITREVDVEPQIPERAVQSDKAQIKNLEVSRTMLESCYMTLKD